MNPDTVHRLAQEIRIVRSFLNADELWWQKQPHSDGQIEAFQRINFWRTVVRGAEIRLSQTQDVAVVKGR
jgi:hypothetical protein